MTVCFTSQNFYVKCGIIFRAHIDKIELSETLCTFIAYNKPKFNYLKYSYLNNIEQEKSIFPIRVNKGEIIIWLM